MLALLVLPLSAAADETYFCSDGSEVTDLAYCAPEVIICPPGPDYEDITIDVTGLVDEPLPVYLSYVSYPFGGPVQFNQFQIQYQSAPDKIFYAYYNYSAIGEDYMILDPDGKTTKMEPIGRYDVEEEVDGFQVTFKESGELDSFYGCLLDAFRTHLGSDDRTAALHVTCGNLEHGG